MTKTDKASPRISPADAVKAKLAEEEAALAEANTTNVDEADLDAADEMEENPDLSPKDVIDLSEDPVNEDPAVVEARRQAFARAEAFERKREEDRARKQAALAGQVIPAAIPVAHVGESPTIPDVFYQFGTALPTTTPDEHVMCGYGAIKLRVGDFRRLIGLPSRI